MGYLSLLLIAAAVVLVTADLVTKYLEEAFSWKAVIIPGFIEISHGIRNPGCAFSFLNQHPEVGQPLLISMTFVLLAVLIFAFVFLPERYALLKVSLTLIIAGALGNLVDRLMFRSVRDFFGLNMFGMMTYCNLADFWIVIGAIIAVVDLLFLNDVAVFPLTKRAKAAQAARREEEERQRRAAEGDGAEPAESGDMPREEDVESGAADGGAEDT